MSSWQLLARSLEYVGPVKGWFALKAVLALCSLLPLLLLPWPVKLVVDHVAQGIPIGAQPLPYPSWLAPLLAPLVGAGSGEVLLFCVIAQLALAVLVGAVGMSATERGVADSRLASGFDRASQTENEANEGTSLASGLVGLADALFTIRLTQRLNHHYRSRVFARIQRLPLRALEDGSIGDSLFRVLYDTPALTQAVYRIAIEPGVVLCFGVIVALTLAAQFGPHPRLWQVALALLALALVVTVPFAAIARRRSDESRRAGADTAATLEESLHNVLAVQSLGAEGRARERFSGASFRAFESFRGLLVVGMGALAVGLIPATALLAYAFVYVGDLVIAGELTPGDFLLLTTYFGLLAFVCLDLGALWLRLQDAAAGLARTSFLLDLPGEGEASRPPLARLRGSVRLCGVALHQADGTRVLEDIELEIPVGRTTALVGPAGAGKTTLAQLLPRFLEPTRGRVLWDGVDAAAADLASVRAQIGFVFQETQLFDATIEENLRVSKPDASEAELWSALRSAGAEEFVRALPAGLATPLGRSGGALSVGQRQRVAIARALVRNPALLVLDEPTSALDPETERRLVTSLRAAGRERAVLVVAHRLSTIRDADTICFLSAGRILERGSHAELMARPGSAYRAFVELQDRSAVTLNAKSHVSTSVPVQLAEDSGAVLAQARGSLGDVGGRLRGELHRVSGDEGAGVLGRIEGQRHGAGANLRVGEDLRHVVHRRAGKLGGLEAREPLLGIGARERRLELGAERRLVRAAIGVGAKARVVGQGGTLERGADAPEEAVVARRDDDLPLLRLEGAKRCDRGMPRADRPGHAPRRHVARDRVLEQRDLAIEHRDVHVGASPRALALVEGRDRRRGREHAGGDVADRRAHARGLALGLAGQAHDAAHRLHDHVVGRALAQRPRGAEPGDGDQHEPRPARAQALPVVAELRERARPEVLDQHVGAREQALEDCAVPSLFEIEIDRLLAAIHRGEVGGARGREGADRARIVAAARALHLDHARAEIGEHQRAVGPREDARQIDDERAGERPLLRVRVRCARRARHRRPRSPRKSAPRRPETSSGRGAARGGACGGGGAPSPPPSSDSRARSFTTSSVSSRSCRWIAVPRASCRMACGRPSPEFSASTRGLRESGVAKRGQPCASTAATSRS